MASARPTPGAASMTSNSRREEVNPVETGRYKGGPTKEGRRGLQGGGKAPRVTGWGPTNKN